MPRKHRVTRVAADDQRLRVDGYRRVSTEEQSTDGVSLVLQEEKIRDYCKLYGLDLARIETDAGVSAKTLERPGLATVLDDLDRGRVDGVVIYKLDRLTRSLRDWSDLIERFFTEKAGRRLFSVNDHIDTRTPSGLLVLDIIMTVAQWERREISFRTKAALQGKIGRGERCGRLRFGYDLADDGRTLVPNPREQEAIAAMKRWDSQGMTYRRMAAMLDELGVETKEPGAIWRPGAIHRILTRPID
jgi:DNA invertase Pin-like site-specific DNA recombinase